MLNLIRFFLVFLALLPAGVFAQDSSKYDEALKKYDAATIEMTKQYITMMGMGNILEKAGPQIRAGMIQQIKTQNPTINDAQLNKFVTVFYDEGLIKSAPLLEKITLVLSLDVYTKDEIKAQYDFYLTPVGQSILKKMPIFVGRMPELQNILMTQIMPQAIQKATDAVKKDGFDMKL